MRSRGGALGWGGVPSAASSFQRILLLADSDDPGFSSALLRVFLVVKNVETGERNTHFLGCDVVKQHHTLTQIIMGLLNNGFELKVVEEAEPPKEMMDIPGMEDELRRPMMLLVKAIAKK